MLLADKYRHAVKGESDDYQQQLQDVNIEQLQTLNGGVSTGINSVLNKVSNRAVFERGEQSKIKSLSLVNTEINVANIDDVARANLRGVNTVTMPSYPLPSNNSLFISSPEPQSGYLIEITPLLTDFDQYIGSDYLFEQIGFNPENDILRLGDAYYDTYVVMQEIFEQTGQRYLQQGINSELEQMSILLKNASAMDEALALSPGVSLSAEQVANLTADIVCWEMVEINGQQVLAPKLYLANARSDNFSGGVIAGKTINIEADELNNSNNIVSDGGMRIVVVKYFWRLSKPPYLIFFSSGPV